MLEVVKETNNHLWCFCNHHNDNITPNLSIDKDPKTKGRMRCWACGWTGQMEPNLVDKMSRKKSIHNKKILVDWDKLVWQYFSACRPAYEGQRLADSLNVSGQSLTGFLVGWDGSAWVIPLYDQNYHCIGIQRRFQDGIKCCVEGSQLGLFIAQGFQCRCKETLYICEGFSDTVSVHDLGLFAIGIPSATSGHGLALSFIRNNGINRVVILPDNDDAGRRSGQKLCIALERSSYLCYPPDGIKDVRDWINKYGKNKVKTILEGLS